MESFGLVVALIGVVLMVWGLFGGNGGRSVAVGGLVALVLGIGLSSFRPIPAGHRGVLLRFGAVQSVLGEGAHIVLPGIYRVVTVEVKTQRTDVAASAASKDLQIVKTTVALNYHLSPSRVGDLYKQVGLTYDDRVINPAVTEVVKAVVSKYTAAELITNREKVKTRLDDALSQRLGAYNIIVEPNGVSLTDFEFSPEYNAAIEAKQVAQQESEKQRYILSKATMEAQTAITKAKGEAEANRIKARALESAGGSKVLQREWIEKWDGKLPQVSSNSGVIVDLRSLQNEKQTPQ